MVDLLLWDCGTQYDLADLEGSLYVPATHSIRPRLAAVARSARERGIPRLCTVITHREGDPDLTSGKPDYKTTFPLHCMEGTPGWRQIPETACERPVEIPRDPHAAKSVREALAVYRTEILVEVAGFDPWPHVALPTIFEMLQPSRVAVFGVPADRMVANAIAGLLERGIPTALVEDAVKPFDLKNWPALKTGWVEKGVELITHQL